MSPFPQSVADPSAFLAVLLDPSPPGDYASGHCSPPRSGVSQVATLDSWIKCPETGKCSIVQCPKVFLCYKWSVQTLCV